jgi:hypothetical protein
VTALAIIGSIAIEPEPETTTTVNDPATEIETPSTSDTFDTPKPPEPEPTFEPESKPPPKPSRWLVSAGGGGGVVSGASPTVLLSVPVWVETSYLAGRLLEPTGRLRFERTTVGRASKVGGGARFYRTSGAGDFCPVAFHAHAFRAQPCSRVEAGTLNAKGHGVDPVRSDTRPWFAVGAVVRLRLEIIAPFFAEVESGLLASVIRDRFYVEPDTSIYRPPAVGATAGIGLGVTFW